VTEPVLTTSNKFDRAPINEISILWLSAGLSCDGETIAMTLYGGNRIVDMLLGDSFPRIC